MRTILMLIVPCLSLRQKSYVVIVVTRWRTSSELDATIHPVANLENKLADVVGCNRKDDDEDDDEPQWQVEEPCSRQPLLWSDCRSVHSTSQARRV